MKMARAWIAKFVLLAGGDYNRASFWDDPHILNSQ
jgi:hypothetical protein